VNGQNVNQSFITGASRPYSVAVDSRHIYWTNALGNTIGRAELDGQNVNQSFIPNCPSPFGIAVDPE
jgi:DNA-binding beta-propeller fold protein YncE